MRRAGGPPGRRQTREPEGRGTARSFPGFRGGKAGTPSPWRTAAAQRRRDLPQASRKCALLSGIWCVWSCGDCGCFDRDGCGVGGWEGTWWCTSSLGMTPRVQLLPCGYCAGGGAADASCKCGRSEQKCSSRPPLLRDSMAAVSSDEVWTVAYDELLGPSWASPCGPACGRSQIVPAISVARSGGRAFDPVWRGSLAGISCPVPTEQRAQQ